MKTVFSDIEVRKQYTIMLIEWTAKTLELDDDDLKKEMYQKLFSLSDEELLEKGKIIEEYSKNSAYTAKKNLTDLQVAISALDEADEKEQDQKELNLNYL